MTNEYLENASQYMDGTTTIRLEASGSLDSGMQEAGFEETDGVEGYLAVYKLTEDDGKLYGVIYYEDGKANMAVAEDEEGLQQMLIDNRATELEEEFHGVEVTLYNLLFLDINPSEFEMENEKEYFNDYVKDGTLRFDEPVCFRNELPYGYFADLEVTSTDEEVKELLASGDILSIEVRATNITGEIL